MSDTDDWTEPREAVPSPLEQLIMSAQGLIDDSRAALARREAAAADTADRGPAYITVADWDEATVAAAVHVVDVKVGAYRATATCSKCGHLRASGDIEYVRNYAAGHIVTEICKAARVEVQRG